MTFLTETEHGSDCKNLTRTGIRNNDTSNTRDRKLYYLSEKLNQEGLYLWYEYHKPSYFIIREESRIVSNVLDLFTNSVEISEHNLILYF